MAHFEEHIIQIKGDMQSLIGDQNVSLSAMKKTVDELVADIQWFIDAVKAARWLTKTLKWLAGIGLAWVVINEWAVNAFKWLAKWVGNH
ncbi:hypothetical protein ACFL48_04990 [Pseudomonadota bacterium]